MYLLRQFRLTRVGRKVAGVGSVGTRAWILLMDAAEEPLILQAKEAQTSVLSDFAGPTQYGNQGEPGSRWPAPDASNQRHLPRMAADDRSGRS